MLLRDSRGVRRAFTLVEVIAAIVITGMVVPLAWAFLGQLAEARDHVSASAAGQAESANGARLLRTLVERTVAGADTLSAFRGQQYEAHFGTWCQVPSGWLERCWVRLSMTQNRRAIHAEIDGATPVVAVQGSSPLTFAYAVESGGAVRWQRSLSARLTLPLAVGVVSGADTLVLRIGGSQ